MWSQGLVVTREDGAPGADGENRSIRRSVEPTPGSTAPLTGYKTLSHSPFSFSFLSFQNLTFCFSFYIRGGLFIFQENDQLIFIGRAGTSVGVTACGSLASYGLRLFSLIGLADRGLCCWRQTTLTPLR